MNAREATRTKSPKTRGERANLRSRARGMTIAMHPRVRIRDAFVSVAAIAILIALLAATDDRIRERLSGVTAGAVSHQLTRGSGQLAITGVAARDWVADSGPLTVLVVAGTVLFVCMLRT